MEINLYTTHCSKCVILEKKLEMKHITYNMITDVDIMREKGFMMAPMLEVDGEIMDFTKAIQWVNHAEGAQ